jgi:hypothetical protein
MNPRGSRFTAVCEQKCHINKNYGRWLWLALALLCHFDCDSGGLEERGAGGAQEYANLFVSDIS